MKAVPPDAVVPPAVAAVPTLKRAVRKVRRPMAALRPVAAGAGGLEASVQDAVHAVIQEEVQRMTRRINARLPGVIAQAVAALEA